MAKIQLNISTKLKTNDKFLRFLLSGMAVEVNDKVTDFIEGQAKKMASGSEIYNVNESFNQKDKMENASGYLADTISSKKMTGTKYSAKSKVISRAEHSSWVEWGTGMHGELEAPHRIYPKKKNGVMSWIDVESGIRVFMESTAGQYPKPFMRGAIYKLKATIVSVLGMGSKITNVPTVQNQIRSQSGLDKLNTGLHNQVNANQQSSTKMWDQTLSSQIKRK